MCITVQIGERGTFTDMQIGERGKQRVKFNMILVHTFYFACLNFNGILFNHEYFKLLVYVSSSVVMVCENVYCMCVYVGVCVSVVCMCLCEM